MKKYTILIAEDEESNYMYLWLLLRNHYNVIRAEDGMKAIDMTFELHPDLVLMDIKMPWKTGIEAMVKIREKDTTTPIIMQSSYAFDSDIREAYDKGATAYLTKPILRTRLYQALDELGMLADELKDNNQS